MLKGSSTHGPPSSTTLQRPPVIASRGSQIIRSPASVRPPLRQGQSDSQQNLSYQSGKVSAVTQQPQTQSSFGTVFQAKIVSTGEIVAVKRLHLERKYKNRELQILSMLDHPNICKLKHYFYSQDEGTQTVYVNLVMEYIPFTLYSVTRHLSRQHKTLPLNLIQRYCYDLLNALEHLHSLGICHRDVKPQNLLVSPDNHILKLCDFGSAKFLKKGETSISYICSRFYRAPELVLGATEYSFPIDMWSFGCVLGELLIGHPLFPGESTSQQFVEIVKLLGTPTEADAEAMKVAPLPRMPYVPPLKIETFFRDGTSPVALDLLSQVLVYNPQTRLTAAQAKEHPFFEGLPSPKS